jgi:hypothetical protein
VWDCLAVERLLADGHAVTAFARRIEGLEIRASQAQEARRGRYGARQRQRGR